jgi:hypothetical protein
MALDRCLPATEPPFALAQRLHDAVEEVVDGIRAISTNAGPGPGEDRGTDVLGGRPGCPSSRVLVPLTFDKASSGSDHGDAWRPETNY